MKPFHVVIYNIAFIVKRIIMAFILVLYSKLEGNKQIWALVITQVIFMVPYLIIWWYMSIFKKAMHVATDLLVLAMLAYPLWEENLGTSSEDNGRMMIQVFTAMILLFVVISVLALVPKILKCIVDRAVRSNMKSATFPK